MSIRLSILTTCYSKTPYFVEMLESFLQSGYHFRDTELVVLDNISPPGGDGDTAREYARRYPDLVRVVRNDVVYDMNYLGMFVFGEVRGKYLLAFDYDDVLVPFDFDADMDFLDAHEDYCGVYGIKRLFNAEEGDMMQCHGGDSSLFAAALDPASGGIADPERAGRRIMWIVCGVLAAALLPFFPTATAFGALVVCLVNLPLRDKLLNSLPLLTADTVTWTGGATEALLLGCAFLWTIG